VLEHFGFTLASGQHRLAFLNRFNDLFRLPSFSLLGHQKSPRPSWPVRLSYYVDQEMGSTPMGYVATI